MYDSMTTVTVGLDVHARSGGWRRCAPTRCSRSGRCPTPGRGRAGFASLAGGALRMRRARPAAVLPASVGRGTTVPWWRRGWCRSGRAIGSRPIHVTRVSSPGCWPTADRADPSLLAAGGAIRAHREDARHDRMRDGHRSKFAFGTGACCDGCGGYAAQVARRRQRIEFAAQQTASTATCTRSSSATRGSIG